MLPPEPLNYTSYRPDAQISGATEISSLRSCRAANLKRLTGHYRGINHFRGLLHELLRRITKSRLRPVFFRPSKTPDNAKRQQNVYNSCSRVVVLANLGIEYGIAMIRHRM